ncbi:hypothetical protein PHYSODRAFT_324276 [Phytophthora sojae]|uniref:Uncharacterized protein n=1 Tax=Phytophthora sojae (strain P6497) TaxID=1094619 RepID=G4YSJ4_PHYSP|nr:hypothetical protein PHYSODRAFT_324276 [Phytophthora sojae]EGZ23010.1 hypothetical protein PHYSODRAFT_324276 [Phytophthora sojae]|eukprot:XP_009518298.1 hypothetical protein PHYSODRAFT_324276 [Phytophthora sojae]
MSCVELAEDAVAEMEIVEVDDSSESSDSDDSDYEDMAKTSSSGKSADGLCKAESIEESSSTNPIAFFQEEIQEAQSDPETKFLARRWPAVEDEYAALVETEPWLEMFNNRVKYMKDHLPAFWHILHWFMMKTKPEDDENCDDLTIYERAQDLHRKRQAFHDGVARTFGARIKRLIKAGMPKTMICYLYLVDESTKKEDGTRYTLADQIAMSEHEDPGRTQWTTCTEDERLPHAPAKILDKLLLKEHERVSNWVSTKFQ